MIVKMTSILTNVEHEMDIPVTEKELEEFYNGNELIQDKFPHLTPGQREFLMTGIIDEEWDTFIEEVDDNEDSSEEVEF